MLSGNGNLSAPMPSSVTDLLSSWSKGDRSALDELMPLVHEELRRLAGIYMQRERSGHTLQPTALVNEAWIRLVRQNESNFEDRRKFFALAAQIMRHILVDHARKMQTSKRGLPEPLPDANHQADHRGGRFEEFLALDEALHALSRENERQARIIEMHYFGGLAGDEIAALLEISSATVSRDLRAAENWLSRLMTGR